MRRGPKGRIARGVFANRASDRAAGAAGNRRTEGTRTRVFTVGRGGRRGGNSFSGTQRGPHANSVTAFFGLLFFGLVGRRG